MPPVYRFPTYDPYRRRSSGLKGGFQLTDHQLRKLSRNLKARYKKRKISREEVQDSMPLVYRFPTYDPYSYYNGYDVFYNLWKGIVLGSAHEQQIANSCYQQAKEKPRQGTIKIACVLLGHYKPEKLSLEVDNEKVILHGQQEFQREDGFEKGEFKRVFKIPQGVDPTTVTSRITQDGGTLVIEGTKRAEEKANDSKFEAKLDFTSFKPEEINFHLRGNVLTVTGIQVSERHQSRNSYSRCIVLPDDVDPSSITPRLSKDGLLTIEVSRDPALSSRKKSDVVTRETDEADEEPNQKTSADAGEPAFFTPVLFLLIVFVFFYEKWLNTSKLFI